MKYDPALDGLRAIAVTGVIFYHINMSLFSGGWIGIELFFVLSGFLITRILTSELEATGTIRLKFFYVRRLLRLGPALVLMLVGSLLLALIGNEPFRHTLLGALFAATYTINWIQAFNISPTGLVAHTWSLAMEEQFYLIWPIVIMYVPRRLHFPCALILATSVVLWRTHLTMIGVPTQRMYFGFDTHSDALLIGCALALIPDRLTKTSNKYFAITACAALSAAYLFSPDTGQRDSQLYVIFAAGLASAAIIIAARAQPTLRSLLTLTPLVFTGRISYGWYLWHYPFVILAIPHLHGLMRLIPIAASYGVATLSFLTVERYFLRFKTRFPSFGERERVAAETLASSRTGA